MRRCVNHPRSHEVADVLTTTRTIPISLDRGLDQRLTFSFRARDQPDRVKLDSLRPLTLLKKRQALAP